MICILLIGENVRIFCLIKEESANNRHCYKRAFLTPGKRKRRILLLKGYVAISISLDFLLFFHQGKSKKVNKKTPFPGGKGVECMNK